ncbi:hypothetical protein RHGRI_002731 [Rhododendron griersonianum]|uniref:TF-B3 domain-containing protein n=1 Tax=Rhododendron griersonianum TaxID=479676 RepID=A0AAV6LQ51_9ERIC|nr:hypothetical protein RHGRI_002731 [Rhododendron griersonianum]
MSESRELDAGPIDGGGKATMDSGGKEKEEEEAKRKENVTQGQNPSSSEDPQSQDEGRPSGSGELEENPSKRPKLTGDSSEGHDHTQIPTSNVMPEAELGDSTEGANQEEQPRAAEEGREYPHADPDSDEDEIEDDVFLFEMAVPVDNILTIPAGIAREYFPTLSCDTGGEQNLQIDDFRGQLWDVPFTYNREIDGFTNTNQWQQISSLYMLNYFLPCLILFYRPGFRLHAAHYMIEFERRTEYQNIAPEFRAEDLLFELELGEGDIWMSRLFLPFERVHEHFPAIRIPKRSQKKVVVKFTDAQGKNWYMEIVRYAAEKYMIIKWWDEFVKNHRLEAMDVIRFYKPKNHSHSKHFFIEIVKKKDGGASSNQPGGGSGGGDRGGPSTSSGSRKGKEIVDG